MNAGGNRQQKNAWQDSPGRVMDLCTGTGDLAVRLAKNTGGKVEITGYDYSQPMLDLAQKKAGRAGHENIRFIQGDAANHAI